jgi:phage terminase large subunit GpA-like protein
MSTDSLLAWEPHAETSRKAELLRAEWVAGLTPPPRLSVAAWADRYRQLAKGFGAVSGQWVTAEFEVSRGPMLAVTEPGVHEISLMCCTQLMKTEFILNVVGYLTHLDPSPILILQPKDDAAEQFSKERLQPTIDATPVLRDLVGGSDETLTYKPFPGGFVALAGAGSPDNVARRPIRAYLADEVDKYRFTREGNTLLLAGERTAQFGLNWLGVQACSPTVEDESLIAACYERSDQRRASLACPHCQHRQFPDFFKHVNWSKREDAKGQIVEHLTRTARIHCESCGAAWSEGERLRALATIRWHQTRPFECCNDRHAPLEAYDKAWREEDGPEAIAKAWDWWEDVEEGRYAVYRAKCPTCGAWGVDNKHAGFQAGKLFSPSPKDKPSDIAGKWLAAKGKPDDELVWWNTQMGLPHRPSGGKVLAVDALLARRELWAGPVPLGIGAITVGMDVQDYRVEFETVGWGWDEESWSISYDVIDGEFGDPRVQAKIEAYLLAKLKDQFGRSYRIDAVCIDSGGHHTQAVYDFCKARLGRYVWAIKGASERDGQRNPVWPTKRPSRKNKASFRPVVIGGNSARDTIRNRLLLEAPAPGQHRPGYMHFPADRDFGYFEQLTADRVELKETAGRKYRVWTTPAGKANEAADCRVYAYAALCGLIHMGLRLNAAVTRAAEAQTPEQLEMAPAPAPDVPGEPSAPMSLVQVREVGQKKSLASRMA